VELVLGTMYFGTRTDEATSRAMLDRYVAAGGRVLDTANCYSFWTSPTGHGGLHAGAAGLRALLGHAGALARGAGSAGGRTALSGSAGSAYAGHAVSES